MSLTSQKWFENKVHMTFGSYVYSLFLFSDFLKQFWAIYEFSWFYSFYFWILIVTCSYESLEGFHARFEIFRFLYEQWYKFKIEIVKVGKILGCLNFGSADSPRVRGGQSAVHETCSPEKFSIAKIRCGRSAKGPRTVRLCWAVFARGSFSRAAVWKFKGGRSARISRTVREWTKRRILTAELIMSYKGISLVDHIHLGAYEMFELDIYARVACYKMFEWIKCLVFKIELIWMDMIMRWHLVCDIIEYMSCESIQTSWHQVWFNLMKYSSNCSKSVLYWKSE